MSLRDQLLALLGVSAFSKPSNGPTLDDDVVVRVREALGGQLAPMPQTRLRWFLRDLETAMQQADAGDLSQAAQLCRAMRRDGVLSGVLSTRTGGIVSLPKRFSGDAEMCRALEGRDGSRSVFDSMFPPGELALLAADGLQLGVGVAELQPVKGREYPVLIRLDPEWLRYVWAENQWYYLSIAGRLPITPGDGRWILHFDGGRVSPWQSGLWHALGQAWITKQHAQFQKANWEAKLANPARAAVAPAGATEEQRKGFLARLIAWGVNTVFELPPGWDVKIIESNGNGHESFDETIKQAERDMVIGLTGSTVLVDGGTGFANADVHKSIRADLIKATADNLAHTINTQAIPAFIIERWGEEGLERAPAVEWDTTPPKDLKGDADATSAFGKAIVDANAALSPYGTRVDAHELAARFGIPLEVADGNGLASPDEPVASEPDEPLEDEDGGDDETEETADVVDLAAVRAAMGAR